MGFEVLICMLLATVLTGTRPIVDMVQMLKGVEPAHLTKARLRAEREKERTAAALAKAEARRVRPGEDKPTLGDVWRVYWGDAMADAIDLHDRRRQRKREPKPHSPVEEKRQPLWKQIRDLLVHPVGEPKPAEEPPTAQHGGPTPVVTWACEGCELLFTGDRPPNSRCFPCTADLAGEADLGLGVMPGDTPGGVNEMPISVPRFNPRNRYAAGDETAAADKTHPRTPNGTNPEGEDMSDTTSTAGSATGDAHDLESAIHECDLLDDDLTRIDTALDVIDEAIDGASNATEHIEAFLTSKNVDDTTVGGMSSARDLLSADHIKALIDAVSAAKQGVRDTKEALEAMQEGADAALQGADGSIVNGR